MGGGAGADQQGQIVKGLPMAPELLLRQALAIVETAGERGLQRGDTQLLVRLMELIKLQIDLGDPRFKATLTAKLQSPGSAELLQLWHLASLAARHKQDAPNRSADRSGK